MLPVTTHQVRLRMILNNWKVLEGEREIYLSQEIDTGYKSIFLEPYPRVNPRVLDEIKNADLIVIGPGGFHTSIIPNLLVEGVTEAISKTQAKKIFVVNLMNRKGQTTGYKVSDYMRVLTGFLGEDSLDYILVNNKKPPDDLIARYSDEGEIVENDLKDDGRVILADLLGPFVEENKKDLIKRSLIRHDTKKIAQELMKIVNNL